MDRKHQIRREAALVRRVADRHASRLSLTDPLFNLREIVKQMLLLEDHLLHPYKSCPDCIRKHLLTIEALAEEATSLDQDQVHCVGTENLAELARQWMERLLDAETYPVIGNAIRQIRKRLTPKVCDPRQSVSRVASVYLEKHCPHIQ